MTVKPTIMADVTLSTYVASETDWNTNVLHAAAYAKEVIAGTNDLIPASLAMDSNFPRYNVLTNGGFEQRWNGNGPFTVGTVIADCWRQLITAPSTVSTAYSSTAPDAGSASSLVLTYTHGSGGFAQVYQNVEDWAHYAGQTVTFRMRYKASGPIPTLQIFDGVGSFVSSAGVSTGAWQTLSVTATLHTNATALQVSVIVQTASGTISFSNATLVFGPVAGIYRMREPGDNIHRCMRYHQKGTAFMLRSAGPATEIDDIMVCWSPQMSVTPTVTTTGSATAGIVVTFTPSIDGVRVEASSVPANTQWSLSYTVTGDCTP